MLHGFVGVLLDTVDGSEILQQPSFFHEFSALFFSSTG